MLHSNLLGKQNIHQQWAEAGAGGGAPAFALALPAELLAEGQRTDHPQETWAPPAGDFFGQH